MTASVQAQPWIKDRALIPLWVWLGASFWAHALIFFVAFAGGGRRGAGTERDGPPGMAVEFSVAGAANDTPSGQTQPAPGQVHAEPAPEQAEQQPAPVVEEVAQAERVVARHRRPQHSIANSAEQVEASAPEAPPGAEAQTQGTNSNETRSGGQFGDAERAVLGAAGLLGSGAASDVLGRGTGSCDDSMVGTWRSQKYRGEDRSWVRFTLHVERDGDRLHGTILSRIWYGQPGRPTPGECTAFGGDHTWEMQAEGRVDGDHVIIEGRTLRLVREDCPGSGNLYAIDHFSGTVQGDALRVMNNDGAYDVNEPYTFRRIACD